MVRSWWCWSRWSSWAEWWMWAAREILRWSVIHKANRSYPNGPAGNDELRVLWTPPVGAPWKTTVILSHTRGDCSVLYACPLPTAHCPLPAAARYAVLGFGTRYMNNNTDCLHEACITDERNVIHRNAKLHRV